jgi:hypothetical protein
MPIPVPPPLRIRVRVETFSGALLLRTVFAVPFADATGSCAGQLLAHVTDALADRFHVRTLMTAEGTHMTNARVRAKLAAVAREPLGQHTWSVMATAADGSLADTVFYGPDVHEAQWIPWPCYGPDIFLSTYKKKCRKALWAACGHCSVMTKAASHFDHIRVGQPVTLVGHDSICFQSNTTNAGWHVSLAMCSNAKNDAVELAYLRSLGCKAKTLSDVPALWTVGNVTVFLVNRVRPNWVQAANLATSVDQVVLHVYNLAGPEYNIDSLQRTNDNKAIQCTRCRTVFRSRDQTRHTFTDHYGRAIEAGIWHLQRLAANPHMRLKFDGAAAAAACV